MLSARRILVYKWAILHLKTFVGLFTYLVFEIGGKLKGGDYHFGMGVWAGMENLEGVM